jgi:hypothetical protein
MWALFHLQALRLKALSRPENTVDRQMRDEKSNAQNEGAALPPATEPADSLVFSYPLIHQYAQNSWHSESLIYATADGLRALREAIDHALEHGTGFTTATVNDGEGYFALVVRADESDFDGAQGPYCDPDIFPHHRGASTGMLPGVEQALTLAYTSQRVYREGIKKTGEEN